MSYLGRVWNICLIFPRINGPFVVLSFSLFTVADPGEGPAPLIFFKKNFNTAPPPPLSQDWMTGPPPYLKVWIRQWFILEDVFKCVLSFEQIHLTNIILFVLKTESIRKLSNFNFQRTKTLYQNILSISHSFLHISRAIDVISYL